MVSLIKDELQGLFHLGRGPDSRPWFKLRFIMSQVDHLSNLLVVLFPKHTLNMATKYTLCYFCLLYLILNKHDSISLPNATIFRYLRLVKRPKALCRRRDAKGVVWGEDKHIYCVHDLGFRL